MNRQYSSRIQRNKGIKVKHALRICLLVAICFWLIYQVKHLHEESDPKGSMHRGSSGGLIKIRRKDLRFLYQNTVSKNKRHNEATEEQETAEEVENNPEEDSSTEKKVEEGAEALRDGNGETEKLDTEVDREEDSITTDETGVDGIDSSTEGEISDNGNGRNGENSVEDGGHDGGDKSYHEAREEFYSADETSSAVTNDNHTQTTENENEVVGIFDQHHENILEQEHREKTGKEAYNGEMKKWLELDGGEISEDANPSSATDIATNLSTKESNLDSLEEDWSLEASNSTADVPTQNPKLSEQHVTQRMPELDHDQGVFTEGTSTEGSSLKPIITLELAKNFTLDMEDHLSDINSTGHTASKDSESNFEDFSEPNNDTDSFTLLRITRSDHSLEDGTNTQKNETVSAITENPKEVHIDSTDLSDSANS